MNTPVGEHTVWYTREVQPHRESLRAFLVARYPALTDVDDLVQECVLRVLHARVKAPIESPRGLLFAIARNLAIDALRRQRLVVFEPLTEARTAVNLPDSDDVAETVSKQQEIALLTQAIQALPERCRQVLTLRVAFGLSQREIARRLGISENTVEKQLAKGSRRCAEYFAGRGLT